MPGIDFELLADHVLTYLDLDPQYWNRQPGVFVFDGCNVLYERYDDVCILKVADLQLELARP